MRRIPLLPWAVGTVVALVVLLVACVSTGQAAPNKANCHRHRTCEPSSSPPPPSSSTPPRTPPSTPPSTTAPPPSDLSIRVSGDHLVDGTGNIVQLRGV